MLFLKQDPVHWYDFKFISATSNKWKTWAIIFKYEPYRPEYPPMVMLSQNFHKKYEKV